MRRRKAFQRADQRDCAGVASGGCARDTISLLSLVQAPVIVLVADLRVRWQRGRAPLVDERDRAALRFEVVFVPVENLRQLRRFRGGIELHPVLRVDVSLRERLELSVELVTAEGRPIQWRATAARAVQREM